MDKNKIRDLLIHISNIRTLSNNCITAELKKNGLNDILPAHGAVFSVLTDVRSGLSISEIARRTRRVKSTISVMIVTLEKKGYVQCTPSPYDHREITVSLTEKYLNCSETMERISRNVMDHLYSGFSEEDKEHLLELLLKIEDNLQSERERYEEQKQADGKKDQTLEKAADIAG